MVKRVCRYNAQVKPLDTANIVVPSFLCNIGFSMLARISIELLDLIMRDFLDKVNLVLILGCFRIDMHRCWFLPILFSLYQSWPRCWFLNYVLLLKNEHRIVLNMRRRI